jgi:nitrate/TMAO reductase-like tetraheme cytochrome c subunit
MAEGSFFSRLSKIKIFGASLIAAAVLFVGGIVFWGAFNTAMEATNQMDFCVSCHEMDQAVYPEYQQTIHYKNRTGVQATCPDCHVPRPWLYKIKRKIQASNEVFHWLLGDVNNLDKFESKRLSLAKNVWKSMKETDSRECRNCHSWDAMTDKKQKRRAWKQHQNAKQDGLTCIDCHKGIAHRNVHQLIEDETTFYDGIPNHARLDVLDPREEVKRLAAEEDAKAKAEEETKQKAAEEAAANPAPTAAGGSVAGAGAQGIAWDGIKSTDVTLLYPGQASMEWVLNGTDHGGARAVTKTGDRCAECHKGEEADMGAKIVVGDKAETTPIPSKPAGIKLNVKAANDGTNLYMRFEWKNNPHTPAPFAEGGKMDNTNPFKLAMMINSGKSEFGEQAGCWATCHHDSRYMPDTPEKAEGDAAARLDVSKGITKYLQESRTGLEIKGRDGKKRGGWDKLKSKEEIDALLKDGVFLDLLRYNSGTKVSEDGYVLEQRHMTGGQGVQFVHEEQDGKNVVYMTRKLTSDKLGDVSFETAKLYKVGFAIHDDFTNARFHHVSIDWYLGLDNADAQINAVTVAAPAGGSSPAGDTAAAKPAAAAPAVVASAGGSINWAGVKPVKVPFFYPGQASMEWIYKGTDHGGARAVTKAGDRCSECHKGEQADMGARIVGGDKAELTPIPGKGPAIQAEIKATHDAKNIYFQVSWKDTGAHNPVPFADGGKMDKDNQVKLAMMIAPTKEDFFGSQAGCWATCHHDNRYMPDTPEGKEVTKYLNETRTEFEYNGRDGKKRGAWDKLKPQAEIDALLKDGTFLDLMRFKSGKGGQFENGYVLDERVMGKGVEVTGSGVLKDGIWTVTLQRPLSSTEVGDVSFEAGKEYVVGFAIHDDFTNARFHHVTLELKMQLDNQEADINVEKQ